MAIRFEDKGAPKTASAEKARVEDKAKETAAPDAKAAAKAKPPKTKRKPS